MKLISRKVSLGRIWFTAEDDRPMDITMATKEQDRFGYHPDGYGGPNSFRCEAKDGKYFATWYCYDSCD